MPRFLFHIYNDDEAADHEGQMLTDLDAARAVALRGARGIMAHQLEANGHINLSHWIEIEDENGEITVVTFRDAVTLDS